MCVCVQFDGVFEQETGSWAQITDPACAAAFFSWLVAKPRAALQAKQLMGKLQALELSDSCPDLCEALMEALRKRSNTWQCPGCIRATCSTARGILEPRTGVLLRYGDLSLDVEGSADSVVCTPSGTHFF